MSKKQKKNVEKTPIINQNTVKVDIDYEKLAEAIVKVQSKYNSGDKKTDTLRKKAMSVLNGIVYMIFVSLSLTGIYVLWSENYLRNEFPLIIKIIGTVVSIFVAIYAFLCQQESLDDDENNAMNHFNSNISLVALLVTFVALFRGV